MAAPECAWNISYHFSGPVDFAAFLLDYFPSFFGQIPSFLCNHVLIIAIQIVQMNVVLLLEIMRQSLINA